MITLVSPWYGPDTVGGAETQARSLARALHACGAAVRVWASTGRDSFHLDEVAHYSPGHSVLDGIPLWRFGPTQPDEWGVPHFFRQHPELQPPLDTFHTDELSLLGSLLGSDQLYEAILAECEQSVFIFIPYAFPTSFWGALIAPERSFLLPCLHDEPYARYATYRYLFSRVRGVLANSYPEGELVRRLYALTPERVHVPGEGIDLTPRGDRATFFVQSGLADDRPLLLYVGRRDESKNISLLLAYIREYWARRGSTFRMLLAGRDPLELPRSLDARHTADAPLVDLGFLDETTKYHAYAAANVFIQPSIYESFSIVLMEAWLQGTPALVYAGGAVTSDHAHRSGGGLVFDSFGTFAVALDLLLARPDLQQSLGARGRRYVLETCDWEVVARRTLTALDDVVL